jgi:Cu/Zn superoxide dismutase
MAFRSGLLVELVVGLLCLSIAYEFEVRGQDEISAICTIESGSGVAPVYGKVQIYQKSGSDIQFDVSLRGFNTSTTPTEHGFHIHQDGGIGNKCSDAGPHYNPDNVDHAGPNDTVRHVGDLGNVVVDTKGEVNVHITDHVITLFGDRSVIGRPFVIHEKNDDLGRGNFSDSKTTGHAGARFGCCIIQKETSGAGNRWLEGQMAIVASLLLATLISVY